MIKKKAAPRSCNYGGANGATAHSRGKTPTNSIPAAWTPAQCRAIEIGMGGGWLLLALLAVVAW